MGYQQLRSPDHQQIAPNQPLLLPILSTHISFRLSIQTQLRPSLLLFFLLHPFAPSASSIHFLILIAFPNPLSHLPKRKPPSGPHISPDAPDRFIALSKSANPIPDPAPCIEHLSLETPCASTWLLWKIWIQASIDFNFTPYSIVIIITVGIFHRRPTQVFVRLMVKNWLIDLYNTRVRSPLRPASRS